MYGLKTDWEMVEPERHYVLEDYEGAEPRWCPGCGDHAVLSGMLRLARENQLIPEKTVVVSGIGCSSRFPHYLKTYGFHGLHGRPLPVASGLRSRRPDLDIFVITGDGDCCAIGTAHWIHAIRYNMNMTVLLLDNSVYGLTKKQTSPTSPLGFRSATHPAGAQLPPIDPIAVTLGIANASFVAQSVDWNPAHVMETLRAAHAHQGLSFVRILQRCPHFTPKTWSEVQSDPSLLMLLEHEDGISLPESVAKTLPNKRRHDPADLPEAHAIASQREAIPIGLLYRNRDAVRYDLQTAAGLDVSRERKLEAVQAEIDRFLV
jgi:2-oxoglutarate ferredoxin oxidoreductase subunit beta